MLVAIVYFAFSFGGYNIFTFCVSPSFNRRYISELGTPPKSSLLQRPRQMPLVDKVLRSCSREGYSPLGFIENQLSQNTGSEIAIRVVDYKSEYV
jgi:hypothetical protein